MGRDQIAHIYTYIHIYIYIYIHIYITRTGKRGPQERDPQEKDTQRGPPLGGTESLYTYQRDPVALHVPWGGTKSPGRWASRRGNTKKRTPREAPGTGSLHTYRRDRVALHVPWGGTKSLNTYRAERTPGEGTPRKRHPERPAREELGRFTRHGGSKSLDTYPGFQRPPMLGARRT